MSGSGDAYWRGNWAGTVEFTARERVAPTSVGQVSEVVAEAASRGRRVRVLGTRHCFNEIADVDGLHLTLRSLPRRFELVGDAVVVDGGATYTEVNRWLATRGRALANLASLPHISVAGAVATATHGSGDGNRGLASAVRSLTFAQPDGNLRTVARGDDDFELYPVHLGLFGPVVEMTLDTVPAFEVATTVYEGIAFHDAVDGLDDLTPGLYSFSLAPNWADGGRALLFAKHHADAGSAPDEVLGAPAATVARHPSPGADAAAVTEQLGVPGPSHERLTHFRSEFEPSVGEEMQSEYLVPRAHAREALAALPQFAPDFARLAHSMEIRSVAADDLALSPMRGTDVIAVHLTWRRDPAAVRTFVPSFEAALDRFDARPHWGKVFTTGAARLRELFPMMPQVAERARDLDPAGVFRNAWIDSVGL